AIVLFDSRVMHAARPNKTESIRWSFDLRYNPIGQPSGRSWYPGFVARSRSNPDSELHDAETWADSWRQTRQELARDGTHDRQFTRCSPDHSGCA
ncbi:MAG: phytanoyl-CoA dioxygenase, partial [Verrucomicrobia bacterium]